MHVLPVEPLMFQLFGNVEVGLLGWLHQVGEHFAGESSKTSVVDTLNKRISTLPFSICSLMYSPVALKMMVS